MFVYGVCNLGFAFSEQFGEQARASATLGKKDIELADQVWQNM